eukprot:1157262-Pelagomonas_calceolata.AAC.2
MQTFSGPQCSHSAEALNKSTLCCASLRNMCFQDLRTATVQRLSTKAHCAVHYYARAMTSSVISR